MRGSPYLNCYEEIHVLIANTPLPGINACHMGNVVGCRYRCSCNLSNMLNCTLNNAQKSDNCDK